MSETSIKERRSLRTRGDLSPRELLDAQLRAAQCQLAMARESLIAARRRVVELEGAVANWTEFAHLASVTTPGSN
jgi:hypothetical protein